VTSRIPDRVFAFLGEKIDTVPELESLLLLWEDPKRTWTPDELAARIYVPSAQAAVILQALQRRQLAFATAEQPERFGYEGAWDVSGDRMAEIAASYRRNVVQIATFIHSGASASVREFARAFDLKKER
jgi:hypothetical protein